MSNNSTVFVLFGETVHTFGTALTLSLSGISFETAFCSIWSVTFRRVWSCQKSVTLCCITEWNSMQSTCLMWLTWCIKRTWCPNCASTISCLHALVLSHVYCIVFSYGYHKHCSIMVMLMSNNWDIHCTVFWLRQKKHRFSHVLHKLERDAKCQRQTLKSFLVLPFQRITRIKLILEVCRQSVLFLQYNQRGLLIINLIRWVCLRNNH